MEIYVNAKGLIKVFMLKNKEKLRLGTVINEIELAEKGLNRHVDFVEVKHGHNKTSMHPVDEFWCSECGFCCADYTETKYDEDGDYTYSCECEFDYCPRCGAKMDKESAQ